MTFLKINLAILNLNKYLLAYVIERAEELCQLTKEDEQDDLRFEDDTHYIVSWLTASCTASTQRAKGCGLALEGA